MRFSGGSSVGFRLEGRRSAFSFGLLHHVLTDSLTKEVVQLVAQQTGVPSERISPQTTLFGDLGIDGDDAAELLAAFAEQFRVDLSEFESRRHFGGEGMWPHQIPLFFWRLFRSIRGDEPHEIGGVVPVRVGDLVRAAQEGRWVGSTP